jgi:hypothetical protein
LLEKDQQSDLVQDFSAWSIRFQSIKQPKHMLLTVSNVMRALKKVSKFKPLWLFIFQGKI